MSMARWLALLLWLLNLSTWKTFFVHIFWKLSLGSSSTPAPLDEDNKSELGETDQVSRISLEKAGLEEIDADSEMPQEVPILEDFHFEVLDESVYVNVWDTRIDYAVRKSGGKFQRKSEGLDHDTTIHNCNIWRAIANSMVIKTLKIEIEISDLQKVCSTILEGVFEALVSHQSVEKLIVCDLQLDSKVGIMKHMSRVLQDNKRLVEVEFLFNQFDKQGALAMGDALRHNCTLKMFYVGCCVRANSVEYGEALKLLLEPLMGGNNSNNTLEKFGFKGEVTVTCHEHIATIIRRNTSLKALSIGFVSGDPISRALWSLIGDALCFNTGLLHILISILDCQAEVDVLGGLFASLIPNAHGQQANTTLKSMELKFGPGSTQWSLGFLTEMLQSNTSLNEFRTDTYDWVWVQPDAVVKLFESLKSNKCLQKLNLSGCKAVRGYKVLGTIMDLLLENHHLREIDLRGTDLHRDGSNEIIQAVLEKKAKDQLWEVVQGMATTTPNSGRVFLCGDGYAGKTTFRKTIMDSFSEHEKNPKRMKAKSSWMRKSKPTLASDLEEQTRGIEVHNLRHDNIEITIWDMAGQEEYHAFHDLVVPNLSGGGSCCSFVLACNPEFDQRTRNIKTMNDIVMELRYWLRFIASNTRISASYRPHVTFVFTHFDIWSLKPLFHQRIKEEVHLLKQQFQEMLDFDSNDFMIDARHNDSVGGVFKVVVDYLKALLTRLPKIIHACVDLQHATTKWIQENPNHLLLDWEVFSSLCNTVPDLIDADIEPQLAKRRKEFATFALHDGGHLMYYEDLNLIIMNPHWFCHNIMGELIAKCMHPDMLRYNMISGGCISKAHLQSIFLSFSSNREHRVSFQDVLQVMLKLELCYEQNENTIMIPSTLQDGHGDLSWPSNKEILHCNYIGKRLACKDMERTVLSPGFFPRLQVSLQKAFHKENTYKIKKDLITFIHDGIEVVIEFSGNIGFDIDIMVRSDEDEDIILDFVHEHLIKHIYNLCGHPILGCPGVRLVEYIMRPSCVKELVPCKYRRQQVVLVENLKKMVLASGNLTLKYNWKEEGPLERDHDLVKILLGREMWDDVLDRRLAELRSIQDKLASNKPDTTTKTSSVNRVMPSNILTATKPTIATNNDLWDVVNNWGLKLYATSNENKMEVLDKLHKLEDKLLRKMEGIKSLQEGLLPQICTRLDALINFTMEFQQHKYPRLAYFKARLDKDGLKRVVTRMIPGMKSLDLHLLCEHKDGFHVVEEQEGCKILVGTKSTEIFETVIKWGLRVFSILLKVIAHVGVGMGSMIPDLGKDFMLVMDTAGILDGIACDTLMFEDMNPYISSIDEGIAQNWLIDLLKSKCKSYKSLQDMFNLQKVRYKASGSGSGCVAWVCNHHALEGENSKTIDPLVSEIE